MKHNLHPEDLQKILSDPTGVKWTLSACPTVMFYADLQEILKKKRFTSEDIGFIYRSIDLEIRQNTKNNLDAYKMVNKIINEGSSAVDQENEVSQSQVHYNGRHDHFVKQYREKQEEQSKKSLEQLKIVNKRQQEQIESFSCALEVTRRLVMEKNKFINNLEKAVKRLEIEVDTLEDELRELKRENEDECSKYEAEISSQELQQTATCQVLSTFSSRAYTKNVRQLYYSLLAMRLPPRQIEAVVKNVIMYLVPHMDTKKLRLPQKSCASYMRSQEMATISRVQKAADLMQSQQWHLNSDGTTLHQ